LFRSEGIIAVLISIGSSLEILARLCNEHNLSLQIF